VPLLAQRGVVVKPLLPANCGFDVANGWSEHFRTRFVGQPVKPVVLGMTDAQGVDHARRGEFVVTETGVEGSLIYAQSALLRDAIGARGPVSVTLDLAPDWTLERMTAALTHPRGSRSWSSHLQSRAGITGVKAGLLREIIGKDEFGDAIKLSKLIKELKITLKVTRPLDEAISSAGGVEFEALDARQMLQSVPGVFCAGEMLDWEAPTGGYLLSACFASGRAAGRGVVLWLGQT
jgi:uncharacterized flavoprotein (TIGR03862 family)